VNETAVEESSESDAEQVSAETESTEEAEGSSGNARRLRIFRVLDMFMILKFRMIVPMKTHRRYGTWHGYS
jgi:hypothetical protein